MKSKAQLMALVDERIAYLNTKMVEVLDYASKPVKVKYGLRGDAAGAADSRGRLIDFNFKLLQENEDEFIEHTVPHEFAHIAVVDLHGLVRFHHGREWQGMMKRFGVPAQITHQYKPRRIHSYSCGCSMHDVSEAMHRQITKGAEYTCTLCKKPALLIKRMVFKGPNG